MHDFTEISEGDAQSLSGGLMVTMADIFLALVGVVVLMLLTLVPALRSDTMLAPSSPFETYQYDWLAKQAFSLLVFATDRGVSVTAGEQTRDVPLDGIFTDVPLSELIGATLDPAARTPLLAIEPDGQEAAFLFTALAGSLGLQSLRQVRLDAGCGHVLDALLRKACLGSSRLRRQP